MLDLRIINARILTGEGADGSDRPQGPQAPLGVRDGKIVLGIDPDEPARQTLDAQGAVCCPGFIDIHSHSDYAALYAPDAISKTLTGFTTELNGNCGYGAFPLYGPMKEARQQEYAPHRLEIDWEQTAEYFDRCRREPMALNQGLLIGQGTLRGSVVGLEDRPADPSQRTAMVEQVTAAMDAGCFGISTGLVYAPGSFASGEEIEDLVRIVAERGGLYASHLRSESDGLIEALDEFLSVCRKTGCRAQYSHIKAAGRRNWAKMDQVRRRMEAARAEGLELYGDRYPYTASCTDLATILLPNDALGGGREAIVERLENRATRAELKHRIQQREQVAQDGGAWFEQVMIGSVHHPALNEACGKTLAGWAEQTGASDPLEAAFDLLIADGAWTDGIHFSMSEQNMQQVLQWPDVMIGSDACLRDQVGDACSDRPHPRAFGTPARVLGQLCRDAGWFSLSEAVHKLTGLPASVMRLPDRGLIRDGYAADLVIFDPDTIADRATYAEPAEPPAGIRWVLINGAVVVESDGENSARPTGQRPGKLLRFDGSS
ncbi:MAG: amidohydrolase family protein [Phycisphaeraceae bacterium]|nr:amidohydrolase family protein [Phycisphaeraceae bacterium]